MTAGPFARLRLGTRPATDEDLTAARQALAVAKEQKRLADGVRQIARDHAAWCSCKVPKGDSQKNCAHFMAQIAALVRA